jgi:hypothetical protein
MEARDFSLPLNVGILCLELADLSSHSAIILSLTYLLAVRDDLVGPFRYCNIKQHCLGVSQHLSVHHNGH